MQTKPAMGYPFKHRFSKLVGIVGILVCLSGCLSYQFERRIDGVEINDPGDAYSLSETTIGDVLSSLGAPDEIYSLDNTDLLVYERSISQKNKFSLGVPVLDMAAGGSINTSASGALKRYDILAFFFNSQGILENIVFEKGSSRPYLKTLFPE
jgi:hypothetical protein